MPGILVFNPAAYRGDRVGDELRDHFPGVRIVEGRADEIGAAVEEALAAGASYVGAVGGDGTVSAVAAHLAGTDLPLLPVPAGRHNHFAGDLGITDVADAAEAAETGEGTGTAEPGGAARHGAPQRVTVGRVNDRIFVNNASLGAYPEFVRRRDAHEGRLPRFLAALLAAAQHLTQGRGRTLDVEVDGRRERAWMVFVGNGRYGEGALGVARRERLDEPVLDVRVLRAGGRLSRFRVALAVLLGRLERSSLVVRTTASSVEVRTGRPRVRVAVDGEVATVDKPLRFESDPGSLTVLAPP